MGMFYINIYVSIQLYYTIEGVSPRASLFPRLVRAMVGLFGVNWNQTDSLSDIYTLTALLYRNKQSLRKGLR